MGIGERRIFNGGREVGPKNAKYEREPATSCHHVCPLKVTATIVRLSLVA
jgi:hypothetical protein